MATYVEVITSPNCPHSQKALRLAQRVVTTMDSVILQEVSMITQQGQQRAHDYGVKATPTIAINGRVEFVGIPEQEALREKIKYAVKDERERDSYFF